MRRMRTMRTRRMRAKSKIRSCVTDSCTVYYKVCSKHQEENGEKEDSKEEVQEEEEKGRRRRRRSWDVGTLLRVKIVK